MNIENYISLNQLCVSYQLEMSFFNELNEIGLIEIISTEQDDYIHTDRLVDVEKMIRLYHELDINIEGIDIVFNLLYKINDLQDQLLDVKNRLRLYESD